MDLGVSEANFVDAMVTINSTIRSHWPCGLTFWLAYGCIPCTLGFSLCIPNICLDGVETWVQVDIDRYNKFTFGKHGVQMGLKKGVCTSWIEFRLNTKEIS